MYDFSDYKVFKELFKDPYYKNMTIDSPERTQDEFDTLLDDLSVCSAKN